MQHYVLVGAWAAAAYVIYRVVSSVITNRRYAAEAERLGCKPVPMQTTRWPFGLDRVYQAIKADRAMLFTELVNDRWYEAGARTYGFRIMGTTGFFTADPKNIQAVLATQFHDFCKYFTAPFATQQKGKDNS